MRTLSFKARTKHCQASPVATKASQQRYMLRARASSQASLAQVLSKLTWLRCLSSSLSLLSSQRTQNPATEGIFPQEMLQEMRHSQKRTRIFLHKMLSCNSKENKKKSQRMANRHRDRDDRRSLVAWEECVEQTLDVFGFACIVVSLCA